MPILPMREHREVRPGDDGTGIPGGWTHCAPGCIVPLPLCGSVRATHVRARILSLSLEWHRRSTPVHEAQTHTRDRAPSR